MATLKEAHIQAVAEALPPVFAGPEIDRLTGGAYTWSSIRTRKSRGEIPPGCFGIPLGANSPTPMLREPFLAWLRQLAEEAEQAPAKRLPVARKLANPIHPQI
jgi:hypothetical protein